MTAEERKWKAIHEEAEYLKTVSNLQWFIYPFFKMIEAAVEKTCGCCKRERQRITVPNVKEKKN